MLDTKSYLGMKRQMKCICLKEAENLAKEMKLNEYDKHLLLDLVNNTMSVETCMTLGISNKKYARDLKLLLTKIYNYKNTK